MDGCTQWVSLYGSLLCMLFLVYIEMFFPLLPWAVSTSLTTACNKSQLTDLDQVSNFFFPHTKPIGAGRWLVVHQFLGLFLMVARWPRHHTPFSVQKRQNKKGGKVRITGFPGNLPSALLASHWPQLSHSVVLPQGSPGEGRSWSRKKKKKSKGREDWNICWMRQFLDLPRTVQNCGGEDLNSISPFNIVNHQLISEHC